MEVLREPVPGGAHLLVPPHLVEPENQIRIVIGGLDRHANSFAQPPALDKRVPLKRQRSAMTRRGSIWLGVLVPAGIWAFQVQLTVQEDQQRMMDLLHISS